MSGVEPAASASAAAPAPSAPPLPLIPLGGTAAVCDGDTCTF
ncbi:hypothetical protein ACF1AJ_04325 [Leifsonia sp. NPDC014704]